jgi:drug/metabolite transporter (DMT)-like permease
MRRLEQAAIYCAPAVFVVLWSTGFIGGKYGLPYAEPFTYLSLRVLSVVAILGVVLLLTRPVWPSAMGLAHSAITGLLMQGLYLGGVFVAIDRGLSPALVALIVGMQPVLTSTLANRVLGERVTPLQWLGLSVGLFGVFLVVRDNISGVASAPLIAWIASVIALIGITAGTLYQKRFGGNIDWRCGFLFQYGASGILFVACAFLFERRVVDWDPHFIGALVWMVLVLSIGTIWLLYFLIRRSAATRVVSLFYLTPPMTALMAWAIFGDKLSVVSLIGMVVCAAGVLLVNRGARSS